MAGFLGYGASLVLFVLGLRHLSTARTGACFSLAPFIGPLLAMVLLDEPLTIRLLATGLLMGLGLWLHLAERHEHDPVHAPIRHKHPHCPDLHHRHSHGRGQARSSVL